MRDLLFAPVADRSTGTRSSLGRLFGTRPPLGYIIAFYAAYVLGAGFGQWIGSGPVVGITLWPPSGIYVATLMLGRNYGRAWWVLISLLAEMTANLLWFQNSWLEALIFWSGNSLEAMTGAWLVLRFYKTTLRLEGLREVIALTVLAGLIAPIVSATIGASTALGHGFDKYAAAWTFLWVGDATGVLLLAPLLLVAFQDWRGRNDFTMPRLIEAAILLIIIASCGALSLSGYLPFAYIIMPPLLWAAVRFEFRGAVFTLCLLALMAAAFTASGMSQFSQFGTDPVVAKNRQLMLQLFLAISAFSALIVAALSRQNRQSLARLKTANQELEARVVQKRAQLRESQDRLQFAVESAGAGVWSWDVKTNEVDWDDYYHQLYGFAPDAPRTYETWLAAVHSDDRERLTSRLNMHMTTPGSDDWNEEFRAIRPDNGATRWMHGLGRVKRGAGGEPLRMDGLNFDITERKCSQEAVREREQRLQFAVEAVDGATWEYHRDSDVFVAANGALALHHLPMKPTKLTEALQAVHPDDRELIMAGLNRSFTTRDLYHAEYRVPQTDGAMRWLASDAQLLGEPGAERLVGMVRDITAVKEREQRIVLLMREVSHRSKNLLALILSVIRQTAGKGDRAFVSRLGDRIHALALSQDLLVKGDWSGVEIEDLVRAQLAHFKDLIDRRIVLSRASARLSATAAQALGMALHELATNASKYGALSNDRGQVAIGWSVTPGAAGERRFSLRWTESGGPPVTVPAQSGFGSTVIGRMVEVGLGGTVVAAFNPEGFSWTLDCPAARVLEQLAVEPLAMTGD